MNKKNQRLFDTITLYHKRLYGTPFVCELTKVETIFYACTESIGLNELNSKLSDYLKDNNYKFVNTPQVVIEIQEACDDEDTYLEKKISLSITRYLTEDEISTLLLDILASYEEITNPNNFRYRFNSYLDLFVFLVKNYKDYYLYYDNIKYELSFEFETIDEYLLSLKQVKKDNYIKLHVSYMYLLIREGKLRIISNKKEQ
jgi:hypothetical protein